MNYYNSIKIYDCLPGADKKLIVRGDLESVSLYCLHELEHISLDNIKYESSRLKHTDHTLIMKFSTEEDFIK